MRSDFSNAIRCLRNTAGFVDFIVMKNKTMKRQTVDKTNSPYGFVETLLKNGPIFTKSQAQIKKVASR